MIGIVTVDNLMQHVKAAEASGEQVTITISPKNVRILVADYKEKKLERLDDIQRVVVMLSDSRKVQSRPFYKALCDLYENLTGAKYLWYCHE